MERKQPFWGLLLHVSYNMWCDREAPEWRGTSSHICYRPYLRFDEALWRELLTRARDAGVDLVLMDLGDAIRWSSCPEIAVQDALTTDWLAAELDRIRAMGIEPIPKLNFSTAHDAWLGPYSRMVSTPRYYEVCESLIQEVASLFGVPRLFHIGMDEETAEHQAHYAYAVMRQHELWWHDLRYLVSAVEQSGARAWIWSDACWRHCQEFLQRMPRSVLQSNWYYGEAFTSDVPEVAAYLALEEAGFDQAPTGSNWSNDVNFGATVRFCADHIMPERLQGFLQTPWHPTLASVREIHLAAIAQVKAARTTYYNSM